MPEGPEAMINAYYVKNRFKHWTFNTIESNTKTIRDLPKPSLVVGGFSKGKVIIIQTVDYFVHIHLGISGWLVPKQPRIYKYAFEFTKGDRVSTLFLKDRRRFSSVSIYPSESDHELALQDIGIDILDVNFTLDYFIQTMHSRKRNICSILMDQKLFAGLGNYIKNDALYIARISPYQKSNRLDKSECSKLWNSIRWVAFSNVSTWFKEYNITIPVPILERAPKKLLVPYDFFVYDRTEDSFGNEIVFLKSCGGRRTFYAPTLQYIN